MKRLIKTVAQKLLPDQFKRKIVFYREKKKLNKVKTQSCRIDTLVKYEKINLKEIFNSNTIIELPVVEETIAKFQIPNGTGGINPGDRKAIYCLLRWLKPHKVLEIGTHIGVSTVYLAMAQKKFNGDKSPVKLTTVDICHVNDTKDKNWLKFGMKYSPLEMIKEIGAETYVQFICSPSLEYLQNTNERFDFIFLDGSHNADIVYQEIPAALNVMNKNGLILLHDYFFALQPLWSDKKVIPGPFLAVQRLISKGARLKLLPLGKLPWSTKLNSNVTSLALVARS